MTKFDWYKCRFLESAENLKPLVHARTGRMPSTKIAREIAACLQQGRIFYEAAQQSPLEIRPLQLFYGMVGFGKALILGCRVVSLATLRPAHGLYDVSQSNCRIADLQIRIGNSGIFQEFNDVVKDLNRLCYFGRSSKPCAVYLPSASSEQLAGLELSLCEILSRIPGLESLFLDTFGKPPKTDVISFDTLPKFSGHCEIRVDDRELFTDRESLKRIADRWRSRFPFLKGWCLVSASHAWGYSVLRFENVDNAGIDEFAEDYLCGDGDGYAATNHPMGDCTRKRFPFAQRLPPLGGGYSNSNAYAISPINDLYPSEFSLHFAALFVMSSLVRYRPETWAHAVSRTSLSDAPADDRAIALIERFLEINSSAVPLFVVTVLNPNEDQYV